MTALKTFLLFALLCGFILFGGFSNSIGSPAYSQLKLDANRISWTHLTFEAKSFMADVTAQLQLESMSADDVKAVLLKNKQGDALPIPSTGAYKLISNTSMDIIGKSPVNMDNQVWFDPRDATAFGRIRLRQGEDEQKKVYRFTKQGVFRHRKEPKDPQEAKQSPDKWTDELDTFYAYDLPELGCTNVSERLLLVYIASTAEELENDKPLSLCIFGKRQLFQVQLTSAGLENVEVDYIEKKQQSEQRRKGKIKAHKIVLESRPLKSDLEKVENFSFLGFQKNIAFFIDPKSNVPIQLSGEIPRAGKSTLKLQKVQLK
ncbi:MAG: hypothetical protein PVF30_12625 [Desulfobacterales bacterium]|jgi:hypothetical protein